MRNEVIEAYVTEVLRRLPGKDRSGIGFELRGLLNDMLAERTQPGVDEDATVLAMLREFGTPEEVAERFRVPGLVIIPASQSRSFVRWAIAGLLLQWALTLPQVVGGDMRVVTWWFTWGLGALWWPGFLVMASLAAAWFRQLGLARPARWSPRIVDPERVNRGALRLGLVAFAAGVALMVSLPWLAPALPAPLAQVLAFDPAFLRTRAWLALPLWAASFATLAWVYARGRWTTLTRHLDMLASLGFVAVMAWWIVAGPMFVAQATNGGARAALALVIAIMLVDVVVKAVRESVRIRTPRATTG
jgi:hypothetical protein